MEGGVPMLNCLLQHTLRSLCTSSDSSSNSPKWVYAVFWRILPRIYPPPKWDHGGSLLDRTKGNRRNWILVWEDGYCDFCECERAGSGYVNGRFGADIFFKMSHEVYNFGEGLVGKVAADNSHKWVFRDTQTDTDHPPFTSSWNVSIDSQPRAWEVQFNSGIKTIAIISVREGVIQLGSLSKVAEDLNMVINIQRKFSYLQSISGIYAIQRPHLPLQHPYTYKPNNSLLTVLETDDQKRLIIGSKRVNSQQLHESPVKSINLGYNTPQNGNYLLSTPPLFPSMPCSIGALLSKPYTALTTPSYNLKVHKSGESLRDIDHIQLNDVSLKMKGADDEHTSFLLNQNLSLNIRDEVMDRDLMAERKTEHAKSPIINANNTH